MAIVYRTAGLWGAGQGSNLSAAQVDGNFYDLDTRLTDVEDNPPAAITPISVSLTGSQFSLGFSNGTSFTVPFSMPAPRWRGPWAPSTAYSEVDFFVYEGAVGLVAVAHTSASTFDWAATGGSPVQSIYRKLIGPTGTVDGIGELTNVAITSVADLDMLVYDEASELWVNRTPTEVTANLDEFVGDSGGSPSASLKGLVPAASAGDAAAGKVLGAGGSWVTAGGGSGIGDVVGPASSTNNHLALFDGTTGKLLKSLSVSATLDAIFTSTRGSILYRGASGWDDLGPGADGRTLTTRGAGADPTWEPIGKWHGCRFATAAALPASTYNNGTAGTDATLTADADGALSVDGGAPSVGHVILVKDQADGEENGAYVVLDAGGVSDPWIIRRASFFNEPDEMTVGVSFGIAEGTTNAGTAWLFTGGGTITIGTTDLQFQPIVSPGGGDVGGPASAVDDRIATFDGTTGKLIQDSGVGISDIITAVNTQTGTSYTLALADAGDIVEMNNASANTVTIPTNASVAFPVGTVITVSQIGAGATTVAGDTGVTLNGISAGDCTLNARWDGVSLYKRATNTWVIQGAHGGVT